MSFFCTSRGAPASARAPALAGWRQARLALRDPRREGPQSVAQWSPRLWKQSFCSSGSDRNRTAVRPLSPAPGSPQPVLPAKATHRCITETLLPQLLERGMSRSFDTFGHCGSGSNTEDQKYDGGQEPSLHGELDQAVEEDDGYSQDPRHLPH